MSKAGSIDDTRAVEGSWRSEAKVANWRLRKGDAQVFANLGSIVRAMAYDGAYGKSQFSTKERE